MVVGLDDEIFHLPINDGDFSKQRSKSEMIYFKSYQNQYAYRRKIMYNKSTCYLVTVVKYKRCWD